ncbi:MAG: biotin transporter BioY [Paracoccus sp. (in: a-proteobacteria)]
MLKTHQPIVPALLPLDGTGQRVIWRLAFVACGVLALAISAKLHVPMWPVPMTMQTFTVLVIGMVLGPRLGSATLLAYLALGAMGGNVFSGTTPAGPAYFAGPTGGYLLGFVIAGWVVGRLARLGWDRTIPGTAAAMTFGTAIIFSLGLGWMSHLFAAEHGMGWILATGLWPFLPGAALKIALAALVVPGLRRMAESRMTDE